MLTGAAYRCRSPKPRREPPEGPAWHEPAHHTNPPAHGYNRTMSLVVVGSVAYDGVETPHGRVDRMLGGAATYIALSASYFTKTSIVAVVGEDFAKADTDLLLEHEVDLEGLERVPGKTFFWKGKYTPDMNDRETLVTDLNVFADFNPKLPEAYKNAPYVLLGNIQPA